MKTYDEAVYAVAAQYSHAIHDSLMPVFPYEKAEMIGFIYDVDPDQVCRRIKTVEIENRKEWWI